MPSSQINRSTLSPDPFSKSDDPVAKGGLNLAPGRDSYNVLLMMTPAAKSSC